MNNKLKTKEIKVIFEYCNEEKEIIFTYSTSEYVRGSSFNVFQKSHDFFGNIFYEERDLRKDDIVKDALIELVKRDGFESE